MYIQYVKLLMAVAIVYAVFFLLYRLFLVEDLSNSSAWGAQLMNVSEAPVDANNNGQVDGANENASLLAVRRPQFSEDLMLSFAKDQYRTNTKLFVPSHYTSHTTSFDNLFNNKYNRFNIYYRDVLVFVHIQKTDGTTFEKYLALELDLKRGGCQCGTVQEGSFPYCNCYRPNSHHERWIFFRFDRQLSWQCGVHADFTELAVSGCVDRTMDVKEGRSVKRHYFFFTLLREPINRFLSEYRHVMFEGAWKESIFVCNGKRTTPEELPMCFNPRKTGWDNAALDDFINCPYNLAFNRQTRMLADLTLVNCYNTTQMEPWKRDLLMLESAKHNLKQMAFFGIVERMNETQRIFEKTFGLRFKKDIPSLRETPEMFVSDEQMDLIKKANNLDIELYKYAAELFEERVKLERKT